MVIGRAPGGGYDEYGRFMAPLLEKELGQPIVVENVDGAGGAVAASQVTEADARRLHDPSDRAQRTRRPAGRR